MKIIECVQGSEDWWMARRGVPTASEFGRICTPKTMKMGAGADSYIAELVGDTFRDDYGKSDDFMSTDMKRGVLYEEESRRWYEFHQDAKAVKVGFVLTDDGRFGCSPDSMVGDDGLLELKNPAPHTHAQYLLDGGLPPDYRGQVHGQLIVTGRKWVDFVSYFPGLPQLIVRVVPDEYTEALKGSLEVFWVKYQDALKKIRAML